MHDVKAKITCSLVPEFQRLAFFPRFVGTAHMMRFEANVYSWMRKLDKAYNGALWNFYTLNNGGFFLAPSRPSSFRLSWHGNYFDGVLSAEATGVVITLYALCNLANETELDEHINRYHELRAFALHHDEATLILKAID